MTLRYFLGVDIGTSGLKCVLIDEAGQLRVSAFREYTPDLPQPGWAEQNPDVWLDATLSAVREVMEQSDVECKNVATACRRTVRWSEEVVHPRAEMTALYREQMRNVSSD